MVYVPHPWERQLWHGGPALLSLLAGAHPRSRSLGDFAPRSSRRRFFSSGRRLQLLARERYVLTDFRLVRIARNDADDILLTEIAEVQCERSGLDRLIGTATIAVHSRDRRRPPLVLRTVRHGAQLAALLDLLADDPRSVVDADAVSAALAWRPREDATIHSEALTALGAALGAIFIVVIGLHGTTLPVAYGPDDAIRPNGRKRPDEAVMQFMSDEVMPWARQTLGPLKGGPDGVSCETCHGRGAEARGWRMPGVGALPAPGLRERGWERYSSGMDEQIRNAIYGYLAEPVKQTRAAYMREVVVPGMARLLHRQPYDFTKPYAYNRQRAALGCYHCHRMSR